MTAALSGAALRRLAALVGMTGSDHDGEALNALRLAQKLVSAHGCTLLEALAAAPASVVPAATSPADLDLRRLAQLEEAAYQRGFAAGQASAPAEAQAITSWSRLADHCLTHHPRILTAWERDFLRSWLDRGWPAPTPKQYVIMVRVAAKCGVATP
jgi:hypothetical protein